MQLSLSAFILHYHRRVVTFIELTFMTYNYYFRPVGLKPWLMYIDPECSKEDRRIFKETAKKDWSTFLIHRSKELRKGKHHR